MPEEVDREAGVHPGRFRGCKKFKSLPSTSLHLHNMGDGVNCRGMSRIHLQGAPRHLFGPTILTVLFEAESVHRKYAGITRHFGIPLGQDLRDTIPQHAPQTQAEVERVRRGERNNVAGRIDNDGTVPFEGSSLIAIQQGARREGVATQAMIDPLANRFDCCDTLHQFRAGARIVSTRYDCGAQTVPKDGLRILSQYPVYVSGGIATTREPGVKDRCIPSRQIHAAFGMQELRGVRSYRHDSSLDSLDGNHIFGCNTLTPSINHPPLRTTL